MAPVSDDPRKAAVAAALARAKARQAAAAVESCPEPTSGSAAETTAPVAEQPDARKAAVAAALARAKARKALSDENESKTE